jgi:hypothetical protein
MPDRCSATTCRKRTVEGGMCRQHHMIGTLAEQRKRESDDLHRRRTKEEARVSSLNLLEPDPEIVIATGDVGWPKRWVYNAVRRAMCQHDADGTIVVVCHCQACLGGGDDDLTCTTKGHCCYCACPKCACAPMASSFPRGVTLPWFDNPCMGACDSCTERSHHSR